MNCIYSYQCSSRLSKRLRETQRLPGTPRSGVRPVLTSVKARRCSAKQSQEEALPPPPPATPSWAVPPTQLAAAVLAPLLLLNAQEAVASGGEYGLLEGRTAALVHPAVMLSLLVSSCYAGWVCTRVHRMYQYRYAGFAPSIRDYSTQAESPLLGTANLGPGARNGVAGLCRVWLSLRTTSPASLGQTGSYYLHCSYYLHSPHPPAQVPRPAVEAHSRGAINWSQFDHNPCKLYYSTGSHYL